MSHAFGFKEAEHLSETESGEGRPVLRCPLADKQEQHPQSSCVRAPDAVNYVVLFQTDLGPIHSSGASGPTICGRRLRWQRSFGEGGLA